MKTTFGQALLSQAWVGAVSSAQGRFSVGHDAEQLDSGCAPIPSGFSN